MTLAVFRAIRPLGGGGTLPWRRVGILAVLLGLLLAVPMAASGYYVYLLNLIFVYVILALGLNLLMGEAGLFGLAHTAFFGIGIYTAGVLTNRFGVPFPVGMVAGGVLAAAVGYGIGRVSVRLRDIYLALSTFAFGEAMQWVFLNWTSMTGGPNGLRLSIPNFFGLPIKSDHDAYYFVLATCCLFIWITVAIGRSRLGGAMRAVRESEPAAFAVGIDVPEVKARAFALSAFYAGSAGGIFTSFFSYVHPEILSFNLTITVLTMLVVGGIGTIPGPILGAVLLGVLSELLRRTVAYQEIVYGAILLGFTIFARRGLWGLVADRRRRRG
jgi:branched-chain amino acid transport system permease protein